MVQGDSRHAADTDYHLNSFVVTAHTNCDMDEQGEYIQQKSKYKFSFGCLMLVDLWMLLFSPIWTVMWVG